MWEDSIGGHLRECNGKNRAEKHTPNGTCITAGMEKLYCVHCKRTYDVEPASIRLMQANGKRVSKEAGTYRFEHGCFFKELVLLKRSALQKR